MASSEQNTVGGKLSAYDNMRGTNDRASMRLREIMDSITLANSSDEELVLDGDRVITTIKVLYLDTFKKKVSALKTVRTKMQMKGIRGV